MELDIMLKGGEDFLSLTLIFQLTSLYTEFPVWISVWGNTISILEPIAGHYVKWE